MVYKNLLLLASMVMLAVEGYVIFEDCGSPYEIDSVEIEGCERQIPCYLTVGKKINVTITYIAGFPSNSLRQEAFVILNSIQRETTISPQACEATWCPVQVQTASLYRAQLELPTNIALNVRGNLVWHIFNEQNQRVICFRVTIQTQTMLTELLKKY